jgi:hypothetical protein
MRRVAIVAAVFSISCVALCLVVGVTGGFQIALNDLHVSVRSLPGPMAIAACSAAIAWMTSPVVDGRRSVVGWVLDPARSAPTLAAVLACATAATGLAGGLWTAGGADASGYVAEAHLFATGRLTLDEPLARQLAIPDAPLLVSPLGFRPAADAGTTGRLVPTYPPGLPLLMAPLARLSRQIGPFLVVPIAGGLAVWLVFAIGRSLGHPGSGLAAATLFATFPSFLFQLLQPMSDVPVTTAWLLSAFAALTGRPALSGAAAGLAVLVRPNLLVTAVPLAIAAASNSRFDISSAPHFRSVVRWLLAFAPAIVIVAVLHSLWYGAPWRAGYGEATDLFALIHIGGNIERYSAWLLATGGLLVVVLVWAIVRPPLTPAADRFRPAMFVLAAVATVCAYLPYYNFEEWTYLRFLLPAVALLLPMGAASLSHTCAGRLPATAVLLIATLVVVSQSAWQLSGASHRSVFRLPMLEQRYGLTADWLRARTPATAVILCSQQSGSVALNASRSVFRWDLAPPDSLDQLVAAIEATGRTAWILVEAWEQPAFAARHGRSRLGTLDWPPAAEVRSEVQVRVHRVADRAVFHAGSAVATDYVAARTF